MKKLFLLSIILATCILARDYERKFYNHEINSYDRKYYNYGQKKSNDILIAIPMDCENSAIDRCRIPVGQNKHEVKVDYTKMVSLITKMCDDGKMNSCVKLGSIYLNSSLGLYDYNKAYTYYDTACNNGNKYGCYELGNFYMNGYGYGANSMKAKMYFRKACNMGYSDACKKMVSVYDY